jgi:hypothetical protein
MSKKTILAACAGLALTLTAGSANAALSKFEQDVSDTIDRGLAYLDSVGAFNNPSTAGDASGLSMLALLEKRTSGNQLDAPQGYAGASDADKARLRKSAAYILDRVNETSFYSYRDGAWLMAMSLYRLTGGPDKGEVAEIPNTADYTTINEALGILVDRIVANQGTNPNMWSYSYPGGDSSTTQFTVAGLSSVKGVYITTQYADAARLAKINDALSKARTTYGGDTAPTGFARPGYEYGSSSGCNSVLSPTERGFAYSAGSTPSIQQTASGLWVQLAGGSGPSTPMVQNYVEWLRNRYVWSDVPGFYGASYWYYLWSSFKGMQLLRQLGGGETLANSLGTLAPDAAPACSWRQVHKVPSGDYAGAPAGQYFDYATAIMGHQCKTGSATGDFSCNSAPGSWDGWGDRNPYAILVLQRSTGGACTDIDNDGVCDADEEAPPNGGGGSAACDVNGDGRVSTADVFAMLPLAKARFRFGGGNAMPPGTADAAAAANVVSFTATTDAGRNDSWFGAGHADNEVNIADFTRCIFKANGK